ncbi:hypothetical protein J4440_00950 [Candidatus Woesearchaeota archaeon]|nr:hypothetical protein [Candidatus Woesearchaeota archaeon]
MRKQKKSLLSENYLFLILGIIAILLVFNQVNVSALNSALSTTSKFKGGNVDLSKVDITDIKSTAQGMTLLFPLDKIKTQEDAISAIIPTGTPDYGEAMGVSFDDPVNSMEKMAKAYLALKSQAQQNQEIWQRYLNLAAKPTGISCEYCCGIGAQGIDSKGNSRCGCQHNPALQSVTIWLMINTEYSDAEVLKEVYKWKALFFPKDMVGLAIKISGGDDSVLEDLPGMVGGC